MRLNLNVTSRYFMKDIIRKKRSINKQFVVLPNVNLSEQHKHG